jgi:hypothetical protein
VAARGGAGVMPHRGCIASSALVVTVPVITVAAAI